MTKYVTKVISGPDDTVGILMTRELLNAMKLVEGQVLEWTVSDDKIIIERTPLIAPQSQEKN